MKILGIGDHVNCGAALLENGQFVSVVNDERLVREKMVFGVPRRGIETVLNSSGVSPNDISVVAIATRNQNLYNDYVDFKGGWFGLERSLSKRTLFQIGSLMSPAMRYLPLLPKFYYLLRWRAFASRRKSLRRILREEFGIEAPVQFVDHHYCHATSAYYSSEFDDALVVSIDGGGDGLSSRVYDVVDGRFESLHRVSSFNSLGNFYAYITEICGFKAGKHEGKVTGLAARGKPKYVETLAKLINYREGTIVNSGNIFFNSALRQIRSLLPDDFDRADLAASIQTLTEDVVVKYVSYWLQQTGRSKVALAGGLFANVAVNRRVHEIPGVEEVFVHPGMGDEGMPVGASLAAYYDVPGPRPERTGCMDHVYLGPEFSDHAIEQSLKDAGVEAQFFEDHVEREIARLLAQNYVVARFNGRMEYGPRALGNRSIMYAPTDPSINDWLNAALHRTEFMPFAPATLWEKADECYINLDGARNASRFMTITFECTPWMQKNCPGVIHVDGTARPQLVRREDNPSFYEIIREYHKLTGLPSIINTSFNMHEEPIVCTPDDAVRAFLLGRLDYLAIGRWLARNPNMAQRSVLPQLDTADVVESGWVGKVRNFETL